MLTDVKPLRILNLEDDPLDEELIRAALLSSGVACTSLRVQTREDFVNALKSNDFDIILGDFSLPSFDGLSALNIARELRPDVPFVFVSGTIGEEAAIESLKGGATDYVLKQRLEMLVPAVRRAVREAEERAERRRLEEKYRNIFENAVDGIFQSTMEGRFLTVNPAMTRIFGYESPEEMLESVNNVAHQLYANPADREELFRLLKEHGAVSKFEARGRRKDGGEIWISASVRAVYNGGEMVGIEGTLEDITDRRRTEEALRQSEERYRAVVEQTAEGLFLFDAETKRLLETNAAFQRLLGYSARELEQASLYDIVVDDRESVDRNIRLTLDRGYLLVSDRKYRRKDGGTVDLEVSGSVISYGGRRIISALAHDITERRRAEEALRRSEQRFRSLVRYASDIIAILDADGTILYESPAVEWVLGFSQSERIGSNVFGHLHPDDGRRLRERLAGLLRSPGERVSLEYRVRDKQGAWHDFEAICTNLLDDPIVRGIVVNTRDVTERRRAEETLNVVREAERNRIARDLHDDVLQDLADALQQADIARIMLEEQDVEACFDRLERAIREIKRAGRGLRDVVYNLRLGEPGDQPLPRMLESLVELNRRMASGCDIELTVDSRVPRTSFGQKGMDLLRLFQEALVNTRRHSAARQVRVALRVEGKHLLGEVADDGKGFAPEIAAGVGLTGMRERASALGGDLEIQSKPGHGSLVRFRTPLANLLGNGNGDSTR